MKKAMAAGQLVTIMIVLIAFVLIAGTITRFQSKLEGQEAELMCKNSLLLKAKTKIEAGSVTAISTPALCKTLDRKFSAKNKEEALDFVSKNMERCWWMWLEGQMNEIFGPRGIFGSDEKTKCFICYSLFYEDGPSFTQTDLLTNLNTLSSRYRGGGSILSYIQENGYVGVLDESYSSGNIFAVVFASNIEESIWKSSFVRLLGFDPPYNQNGIWFTSFNRFEKVQPCYYEPDIAGK